MDQLRQLTVAQPLFWITILTAFYLVTLTGYCELHGPCMHGGTCADLGSAYVCYCREGYTGQRCEHAGFCQSSPCQNNGTCINLQNGHKCNCSSEFTGPNCNRRFHCNSDPCQNNGTCVNLQNGYKCNCLAQFAGTNCDTAFNCHSNPCQNNATCVNLQNGYRCECLLHFTGANCESNWYCDNTRCRNGGICINRVSGFTCNCLANYTGVSCETKLHCKNDLCMNNGLCINVPNGFKCNCPSKFTGNVCEIERHCFNDSCLNQGICTDTRTGYICECKQGFSGMSCQYKRCLRNECQHGGSCIANGSTLKCVCPGGFTGRLCETKVTMCNPSPCRNGGMCYIITKNGPTTTQHCSCAKGYIGPYCQTYYGNSAVSVLIQLTRGQKLNIQDTRRVFAHAYTSYCHIHFCPPQVSPTETRNNIGRGRRHTSTSTSITFTAIDIFILPDYPKSLSSSRSELQYTVLFPVVFNQSGSRVLEIKTTRHALESSKQDISKQLGIVLLESKIIQLNYPKGTQHKPGPPEEEIKTWVYIVAALGVIMLVTLLISAVVFCKRRRNRNEIPDNQNNNKQVVAIVNPVYNDDNEPAQNNGDQQHGNIAMILSVVNDYIYGNYARSQRNQPQHGQQTETEGQIPQSGNNLNLSPDGLTNTSPEQPLYDTVPCPTHEEDTSIYQSPLPILKNFDTSNGNRAPPLPGNHPLLCSAEDGLQRQTPVIRQETSIPFTPVCDFRHPNVFADGTNRPQPNTGYMELQNGNTTRPIYQQLYDDPVSNYSDHQQTRKPTDNRCRQLTETSQIEDESYESMT